MDKRSEVAKTMITPELQSRYEALAHIRGVTVAQVYYEALCTHAPNDARTTAGREGAAVVHRFPQSNDRSVGCQSVVVRKVSGD